jgi:transcriptional regulator with GAF, ATPase, and Fis domain
LSPDVAERFLAVLASLSGNTPPSLGSICETCTSLLPFTGASLTLMGAGRQQSVAGAFGRGAAAMQDAAFTLGEGPSRDAYDGGQPVLIADLAAVDQRWPRLASVAATLAVGAVCAVPLRSGSATIGVLTLYREYPSTFANGAGRDCLVMADLVGRLVLGLQAEAASESLAWALDVADTRAVVHQATGMISAQLNVGVGEALVRLRSRAFALDQPVGTVAAEVVAGTSRFER